jgi:phosphoglycerol transferase MdoB-like AlkP superfamily enzyme
MNATKFIYFTKLSAKSARNFPIFHLWDDIGGLFHRIFEIFAIPILTPMLKRLLFLALYWLTWILCFQLFRIIFLTYHYKKTLELGNMLIVQSFRHGLVMDISFASYILVIPALLISFTGRHWKWYNKTLTVYSLIISFVIVLMVAIDLELFQAWGFRIDSTSFHYLETPAEAFASMGAAPVLPLILLFLILFFLVSKSLITIESRILPFLKKSNIYLTFVVFLLVAGSLIIPIRGGLQQIPLNESNAFFSAKSFANYAAVNIPWNYSSSVINDSYIKKNPFISFKESEAEELTSRLYPPDTARMQIIRNDGKVNVLIIIWESFTAKVVGSLGGTRGVTPQFERLAKEGVYFRNIYSSGNRSDKGMVAILSGYPAQPTQSIIKIPTKTASLPSITQVFKSHGYSTSFYYGGETEFANMKSYFLQQGYDHLTDKHDFDKADMNSKWGAHDHVVLNRLMSDLDNQKQPFFTTLFTLSSHEPFEVPAKTAIPGKDTEHLFLNSHHYTDASIGKFIKVAKTKPWWKNTVVVIIADHGHPLPEKPVGKPNEFHIPMLWLGGALERKNVIVDSLGSQTDLAKTLLNQLNLPSKTFKWSSDLFAKNRVPFAYFTFTNGFGWVKPQGFIIRDNIGGFITEKNGSLPPAELDNGKAYLQASFDDYLKR